MSSRDALPTKYQKPLATVLMFGLIALRCSPRFKTLSLWAEDGGLFLSDAYVLGWRSLLHPYTGYFHTVPRLVSLLAIQFSVAVAPYVNLIASLFVAAMACATFAGDEFNHIVPSRRARLVICVGLSFMCGVFETFGNLTNLHWWLALYVALWSLRRPEKVPSRWELLFFTLALATSGEVAALLPLFLYRYHKNRSAYELWCGAGIIFFAALSFFVRTSPRNGAHANFSDIPSVLTYSWLNQFVLQPFLGENLVAPIALHVDWLYWSLACGGTYAIYRMFRQDRGVARTQLALLTACYLMMVELVVWVRPSTIRFFGRMVMYPGFNHARHSFILSPIAFFIWACLIYRTGGRRGKWAFASFFAVWMFWAVPYRLIIPSYIDWQNNAAEILPWPVQIAALRPSDCRADIEISIEPKDFKAKLPPRVFPVCSGNAHR